MKLVDSSVWLALALSGHERHEDASNWIAEQEENRSAAFCRLTQLTLLRLLTTKAVLSPYGIPPLTNEQASHLYTSLLGDRRIGFAPEPPGLERCWAAYAERPSASPKLWMDAYLAAFAFVGSYQLVTLDGAFLQFEALDVVVI